MVSDNFMSLDELCPFVRKAGRQRKASWRKNMRRIYDHELLYCSSGKAHLMLGERYFEITPGSLITIKPDTYHSFWQDETNPAEICWVHFDFSFRKDVYLLDQYVKQGQKVLFLPNLEHQEFLRVDPVFENGLQLPEFLTVESQKMFTELFEALLLRFEKQESFWQLECRIYLLEILKAIFKQTSRSAPTTETGFQHYAELAENYIMKNYHRNITISEIANHLGIHADYLRRCFRQKTGISPVDYLNRFRIMKAKELLYHSDLSLADIAEMVGYNDPFYFCRIVKKYEGVSPSRLRNMLHK